MLKYKHIEASRELRLWIGQVIVPTFIVGYWMSQNPQIRTFTKDKFNSVKERIKSFKK